MVGCSCIIRSDKACGADGGTVQATYAGHRTRIFHSPSCTMLGAPNSCVQPLTHRGRASPENRARRKYRREEEGQATGTQGIAAVRAGGVAGAAQAASVHAGTAAHRHGADERIRGEASGTGRPASPATRCPPCNVLPPAYLLIPVPVQPHPQRQWQRQRKWVWVKTSGAVVGANQWCCRHGWVAVDRSGRGKWWWLRWRVSGSS